MRWRALRYVPLVALAITPPAAGQELARSDPNLLRAPLLLEMPAADWLRGVVQLHVGELLRAVQSGDSAALRSLDADGLVSSAERAGAPCASLAAAATASPSIERPVDLRAERPLRMGKGRGPRMAWGSIDVTSLEGDTIARATVTVAVRGAGSVTVVPVTFAVRREGDAIRIARVTGLLAGICALNTR